MTSDYHRLLLVFVDGVGLAPATEHNPLAQVPTPGFHRLLDGPLTLEHCCQSDDLLLRAIDANLGVEGLPQSATGQTALFTGLNAAQMMGRHVTGLPGPRVRALVESQNLFQMASEMGLPATFANAYTQTYLNSLAAGKRQASVTTCAVSSAGLAFRQLADLERHEAVSWDIVRDRFSEHVGRDLSPVTAFEAGHHLAATADHHTPDDQRSRKPRGGARSATHPQSGSPSGRWTSGQVFCERGIHPGGDATDSGVSRIREIATATSIDDLEFVISTLRRWAGLSGARPGRRLGGNSG